MLCIVSVLIRLTQVSVPITLLVHVCTVKYALPLPGVLLTYVITLLNCLCNSVYNRWMCDSFTTLLYSIFLKMYIYTFFVFCFFNSREFTFINKPIHYHLTWMYINYACAQFLILHKFYVFNFCLLI